MPELPEVETTRQGIRPHLVSHRISNVVVRQRQLRWPVPRQIDHRLPTQTIEAINRRGKYLLLQTTGGTAILHLGMSGSLRIVDKNTPPTVHDHVDIVLDNGRCLRLRDPRRFGALLWTTAEPETHWLLANLGPEPLGDAFDGLYLHKRAAGHRVAIKSFIMDSKIVVGVGNIYANEALFLAGIHPLRAARRISQERYEKLATAVRTVLEASIKMGGTTLRDFSHGDGQPGYFKQSLRVYGKAGDPCVACGHTLLERRIGQRSSFYCPACQH